LDQNQKAIEAGLYTTLQMADDAIQDARRAWSEPKEADRHLAYADGLLTAAAYLLGYLPVPMPEWGQPHEGYWQRLAEKLADAYAEA